MSTRRPTQTLNALINPKRYLPKPPCTKCHINEREVGISWCRVCMNKAKLARYYRKRELLKLQTSSSYGKVK